MPDSNVVVSCAAIIRRVVLDSRDADLRTTASPQLFTASISIRYWYRINQTKAVGDLQENPRGP